MAKSKQIVDLKDENLTFIQKDETIKLLSFNPNSMQLKIAIYKNETFVKNDQMAFAHLNKKLKAKLNPKS